MQDIEICCDCTIGGVYYQDVYLYVEFALRKLANCLEIELGQVYKIRLGESEDITELLTLKEKHTIANYIQETL